MRRVRLPVAVVILVIAAVSAAIVTATSGGSARASRSVAPNSAISLRHTQLGGTLVDANGRTLYLFEADKPNRSTLSAAGQAVWPPLTAATRPHALDGVAAASVGTIRHAGGDYQITYHGHPLYYYVGDRGPGQTRGQGLNEFGALWYALDANGRAILSVPRSTTQAPPRTGGAPSYGY